MSGLITPIRADKAAPPMPSRLESALKIRDHVLQALSADHTMVPINRGADTRAAHWQRGAYKAVYRTPSQGLHVIPEEARAWFQTNGRQAPMPYGLDVWAPKKVLSIEWGEDGQTNIVSFRRGLWESELLAVRSADDDRA